MPMPPTPTSVCRMRKRCAEDRFGISAEAAPVLPPQLGGAGAAAAPRFRLPTPTATAAGSSGAGRGTSPAAAQVARALPLLRKMGLPLAVLCGSFVGLPGLCFIGFYNIFGGDDVDLEPNVAGTAAAAATAAPAAVQPVTAPSPLLATPLSPLFQAQARPDVQILELQRDLRRQDAERTAAEQATASRLSTLESSVSALASAAPAGVSGSFGYSLFGSRGSSDGAEDGSSALAGLGTDWAAWSADASIDHAHTSSGLGRGYLGKVARMLASQLPQFRALTDGISHPPEVVLAADSAPPSRCFTMGGSAGGAVAITFARSVRLTHVAIERLPSWTSTPAGTMPRRFEVRTRSPTSSSYAASLGTFEYEASGPRVQVFRLSQSDGNAQPVFAEALRFSFSSNWGEDRTAVCRLRAFGHASPP
eukprot:TRINITY_DN13444_c0_g1_i1.p1 TRINITY_DN13444_c0_g1~~TRINITY_DN13444_c0_g1_i1.p1  ORF type:complete len:420 (-),score=97.03 TRINITY_DN13444_c0_g1_i1:58-1317(-)